MGQIVAYYKYQTTKAINLIRGMPGTKFWQRNYWEHVIRNEAEMDRIREYIETNPARWSDDQLHPAAQAQPIQSGIISLCPPNPPPSSNASGTTATSCATTACRTATTSSSSPTCSSSRWPTSRSTSSSKASAIPAGLGWDSLRRLDGDALETHYRHILAELGKGSGLIPTIFRKAQNKIQDPAKLRRLIELIDGEMWIGLDMDVKGEIYEGLLEKNAQDIKSGAGQYFTPRPLIRAMVDVMRPAPGQTICDPAAGTGGFLLAAHDYLKEHNTLDREQWDHLRHRALHGWEIVDSAARLCVMNLYLHGIGANGGASPIRVADSLAADPGDRFDLVLTNPPFGKKSSVTFVNEEGEAKRESQIIVRDDFWTSTSNKQLNFIQHIKTILAIHGRAAVVVPDNVLFEGGAGETVRRKLLHECDVHTLLRLPTGIFYAQGSRRTCFSSTASRPAKNRGPRSCGSTTCAPTGTSALSRSR